MKTELINLTPHAITYIADDGKTTTFTSQGQARVKTEEKDVAHQSSFRVVETQYGQVEGLPEPEANTFYIVSFLVKQALPNRNDLLSPNTAPTPNGVVRNEEGQIIGVKSFVK